MNKTSSTIISGFKYVYLIAFFTLLSGFFYPLITDTNFDIVTHGVLILFVGLAGGVLLYMAATSEKRKVIFLGSGFGLIAISFYFILVIS